MGLYTGDTQTYTYKCLTAADIGAECKTRAVWKSTLLYHLSVNLYPSAKTYYMIRVWVTRLFSLFGWFSFIIQGIARVRERCVCKMDCLKWSVQELGGQMKFRFFFTEYRVQRWLWVCRGGCEKNELSLLYCTYGLCGL